MADQNQAVGLHDLSGETEKHAENPPYRIKAIGHQNEGRIFRQAPVWPACPKAPLSQLP
jgi:hypothetical protein